MKVVFLANTYHLTRTKSSLFFIDLLSDGFEVSIVPHKEAWSVLPDKAVGALVAWQHQYSPEELESFGVPRVILIPMYDDCSHSADHWKHYAKFSVISFCKELKGILDQAGVRTLGVQYYPPVGLPPEPGLSMGGFFWQRSPRINWETVRALWGENRPGKMLFHHAAEAGFNIDPPTESDRKEFHISISHWFEDPKELKEKIRQVPVYFAPRDREGIGMSFLEALSEGRCVVSPDSPTMNEYITDGKDGLLYDPDNPKALDLSKVQEIASAAYERAKIGRSSWEASIPLIREFISNTSPVRYPRRLFILGKKKLIWQLRKLFRVLKSWVGK